jgi:hypothetical protein
MPPSGVDEGSDLVAVDVLARVLNVKRLEKEVEGVCIKDWIGQDAWANVVVSVLAVDGKKSRAGAVALLDA